MSKFTGPLAISFISRNHHMAKLLEPLVWDCDYLGSGRTVTIPIGFTSDGVTCPRPLWWFLPPWGHPATRAAILHDWLLSQGYRRREADLQFYLALKALKVKFAGIIWLAVRIYGWQKETRASLRTALTTIGRSLPFWQS